MNSLRERHEMTDKARTRPDGVKNILGASASRRKFVKGAAAAGAVVATTYVAPNMTSIAARPAYASISDSTVTVDSGDLPKCFETKLTAGDAYGGDSFGQSVAVSGSVALVGAYGNSDDGASSGSAYVFLKDHGGANNWGEFKKLTASDAAAGDVFGYDVAIDGSTAVVSSFGNDDDGSNSGAVYVFRKDHGGIGNWGEVKKIIASDAAGGDLFGFDVAISGDTIIVGANKNSDAGASTGSAYIFRKDHGGIDNWGEVKKLLASDAAASDRFGTSVSISGDTAAVGAYLNVVGGVSSGAAYIFGKDVGGSENRGEVKTLTASDAASGDRFGVSVSVSGDTAVVGANNNDDAGGDSGSAYIFKSDQGGVNNWGEVKKLGASDAAGFDKFGFNVAIAADLVVVGAPFNDDDGGDSGSAYVFGRDEGGAGNWGEVKKLTASDAAGSDWYGWSVAAGDNTAMVGAYRNDDGGADSGSAYVYQNAV